jgi:hypothetical protein
LAELVVDQVVSWVMRQASSGPSHAPAGNAVRLIFLPSLFTSHFRGLKLQNWTPRKLAKVQKDLQDLVEQQLQCVPNPSLVETILFITISAYHGHFWLALLEVRTGDLYFGEGLNRELPNDIQEMLLFCRASISHTDWVLPDKGLPVTRIPAFPRQHFEDNNACGPLALAFFLIFFFKFVTQPQAAWSNIHSILLSEPQAAFPLQYVTLKRLRFRFKLLQQLILPDPLFLEWLPAQIAVPTTSQPMPGTLAASPLRQPDSRAATSPCPSTGTVLVTSDSAESPASLLPHGSCAATISVPKAGRNPRFQVWKTSSTWQWNHQSYVLRGPQDIDFLDFLTQLPSPLSKDNWIRNIAIWHSQPGNGERNFVLGSYSNGPGFRLFCSRSILLLSLCEADVDRCPFDLCFQKMGDGKFVPSTDRFTTQHWCEESRPSFVRGSRPTAIRGDCISAAVAVMPQVDSQQGPSQPGTEASMNVARRALTFIAAHLGIKEGLVTIKQANAALRKRKRQADQP